jgi:hypothetical protein
VSREIDLEKVQDDGDELVRGFQAVIEAKYGEGALAKEDLLTFQQEIGALGYAINNLQAMVASLVMERFISQGESFPETVEIVRQMMMADAHDMATEGARRLEIGIVLALSKRKKSTSH